MAELNININVNGDDGDNGSEPQKQAPQPPAPQPYVAEPKPPAPQPQSVQQPKPPAPQEPARRSIFNKPAIAPSQQQPPREPPKLPTHTASPGDEPPDPQRQPTNRFTMEQWKQLGADAEAVAKQMKMLPPVEVERKASQPAPAQQPKSEIEAEAKYRLERRAKNQAVETEMRRLSDDYRTVKETKEEKNVSAPTPEEEAKKRLERKQRAQQVEQEMRRQSPDYRTAQEAKEVRQPKSTPEQEATSQLDRKKRKEAVDQEMRRQDPAYREEAEYRDELKKTAEELRESNEVKRRERLAYEKLTEEEQLAYDIQKEANRQKRAETVKEEARRLRDAEKPLDAEMIPEAKQLHDEEAYRRQAREAMAQRERSERYRQVRREMDPKFAEEEDNREMREQARTVAMGGAAIGGKTGRVLGIASQFMNSPAAMKFIKGFLGQSREQSQQEDSAQPPPPAANIPANERIAPAAQQPKSSSQQAGQVAQQAAQARASSTASSASGEAAAGSSEASAGTMAMAAEAVPVVGAIVALGALVHEQIRETTESRRQAIHGTFEAGKSVLSMDPNQQMQDAAHGLQSVAESADRLSPFLGAVAKPAAEFVAGVVSMTGSVKHAAERLSQYDGRLAEQRANQEVREIMRDINRAGRVGPQVAATDAARFALEQKAADFFDRMMPFVLKAMEKLFVVAEKGIGIVDDGFKGLLKLIDDILAGLQNIGGIAMNFGPMADAIRTIRDLIRTAQADQQNVGEQRLWEDFLSMGNIAGLNNRIPMPAAPDPAIQMPGPAA